MPSLRLLPLLLVAALAACDDGVGPDRGGGPVVLPVLGRGDVTTRYSAELWVHGDLAYTTTWGNRGGRVGNTAYVWNVAGPTPVLVDSMRVEGAATLGDVQVSDDGRLLVVAVEHAPSGGIVLYDLEDPAHPRPITHYTTATTQTGVHTAEVARVNGRLYAFLSVDPGGGTPARLVIVDLSDPAAPREVFAQQLGGPFVHDVFVRDGYLFTAEWDDGLGIWDIGAQTGSPESPVRLSTVQTVGGNVHNVWWYHDPVSGSRRYAFVGEEQASTDAGASAGDIHVVDLSDPQNPREVAFFSVPGAGTHNFWMDEARGILYAAYYNGGVRALDVRGDLGGCSEAQKSDADHTANQVMLCDLAKMQREVARALTEEQVYVWGVQQRGAQLYATDMFNGLWKLDLTPLHDALSR